MKTILINDIFTLLKQKGTYASLVIFLGIGFLIGFKFNISVSEELGANASYSVGFMIGLLSLTIILIGTIMAFSMLFKEKDANFNLIVFSTPIKQKNFAIARFFSFYLATFLGFLILVIGYTVGLHCIEPSKLNQGFNLWHFIYPTLIFGAINSLVVCSILFFIAQRFQNKLLVAITGMLLYVLYMIALMFSNAPFMAQSLPQSLFVQRISAITDIFGISAYFYEGKDLSVLQRSNLVVPFSNLLLINRALCIIFSIGMVYLGARSFSFLPVFKKKSGNKNNRPSELRYKSLPFTTSETSFNQETKWQAILSFIKVDTIYIFKSIALTAVSILMLFYIGVEMFDDINKGIRFPQLYASSGLLAQTINSTLYSIGALAMVYFVNDVYWRSKAAGFSLIENTTFYAKEKLIGHVGSIILLILFLTGLILAEAIIYQIVFDYTHFDIEAYLGVFIFNTAPLILFSLILILINNISRSKTLALGLCIIFFLLFVTPISKNIMDNSLLRFLSGYNGIYSDFLGYGAYLIPFLWRLVFGFSLLGIFTLSVSLIKIPKNRLIKSLALIGLLIIGFFSSYSYLEGYEPKKNEIVIQDNVQYEKKYKKFKSIPQPTIKKVFSRIDLYPGKQKYKIQGHYIIKNTNSTPIDSLLISIPKEFKIQKLTYHYKNEAISINSSVSERKLKESIQPKDSAKLEFELEYKWIAVNGHNPFNAIVENGSFMRISRYFPQFGYDETKEVADDQIRKENELGEVTEIKPLEAPKTKIDDFIQLQMEISTPIDQIAIGTGELKEKWQKNGRNYYRYKAEDIPFRFALSSAKYEVQKVEYDGVEIKVYHHPLHGKNVAHLIENTKLTLDYFTENFGAYPFDSLIFAEVSSFSQGFAGTSYPGVIFMTENMTFHANIEKETNQDVVNELAGHEVAHFWWGNNQISPDYREGYALLTESLAMYTEMMIYKKMHGKEKMMERVAIHQQIYDSEKGFYEETPLLKTLGEPYLAYSKGAVVFVELSELIGEKQLNLALKQFLNNNKYPNPRPIATDLLEEILAVANKSQHGKIKKLFM